MTAIAAETAVLASVRSSGGGGLRAGRHRRLQVFRAVVLVVLGLFFLLPLFALLEFSTRGIGLTAPRTLDAWQRIVTDTTLFPAIIDTLELAALTSVVALVLMVPTMVWVRLRLPKLARQPPTPTECSPTCSAGVSREFEAWLPSPTSAAPPGSSANRATTP